MKRVSTSALVVALVAVVLVSSIPRRAVAELDDEVAALTHAYRAGGAVAKRLAPRFVLAGSTTRIGLEGLEGVGEGTRPCVTVVVMGAPTRRFEVRPALPRSLRLVAPAVESTAGVVSLSDCEGKRLATGAIDVTMGKRAGAVDVIVLRHAAEDLSPPGAVLLERFRGAVPPPKPVGALPLAPLEERKRRTERSARRDGSTFVARVDVDADELGRGSIILRLRQGCHRVAVLAESSSGDPGVDVDALVRLPGRDEPLARDRSHAPDARLDFCIGQTREVELHFVGAAAASPVVVLAAYWALPSGLPEHWGPEALAGFAWALHRRPTPPLAQSPDKLFAGASGVTELPVEVEPSSCYLLAMTVTRGEATGARLTVTSGARRRHDDAVDPQRAAAVTFCTGSRGRMATVKVDLRAQTAFWGLALWRLGEAPR